MSPDQLASNAIANEFGETVERLSVGVLSEETSVALEFVNRYGNKVRFDHTAGAWFGLGRRDVAPRREGPRLLSARSSVPGTGSGGATRHSQNAGGSSFCRGVEEHARRD